MTWRAEGSKKETAFGELPRRVVLSRTGRTRYWPPACQRMIELVRGTRRLSSGKGATALAILNGFQ